MNENQHGFRKCLSVYIYTQQILDILNRRKYVVGLLFDISKAHDRIQHNILLQKFYDTGIRGFARKWMSSYSSKRDVQIDVNMYK